MSGLAGCFALGRWRIVVADLLGWRLSRSRRTSPYQIRNQGWAEFAFGRVEGAAELEYSHRIVIFRWHGFDEGDAIGGSGSAELQDDGSLEIELSSADGDDAGSPSTAKRLPQQPASVPQPFG
jgi:hypothetical protein